MIEGLLFEATSQPTRGRGSRARRAARRKLRCVRIPETGQLVPPVRGPKSVRRNAKWEPRQGWVIKTSVHR